MFLHTLICFFYYLHIISDWFSIIFPQKFCIFYNLSYSKLLELETSKADFSKSHFQRNSLWSYTQMVISQKVEGVWTWIGYQIKAESMLVTMILKTHLTNNVTCSLFCGSASQIRSVLGLKIRQLDHCLTCFWLCQHFHLGGAFLTQIVWLNFPCFANCNSLYQLQGYTWSILKLQNSRNMRN